MIETGVAHGLRLSPNVEERREGAIAEILLLHYTGMASFAKACDWLCDPRSKVSCHYLIDEDGTILQMAGEEMRAWHAGVSCWQGRGDINSRSIGIEIHNPGHEFGYRAFPDAQMRAVIALCRDIVARNCIRPDHVLAHSDVAPGRKTDPGELFDWRMLHEAGVGHWVTPEPLSNDDGLTSGSTGPRVASLQEGFRRFGYCLERTGMYDAATETAVTAFQRHFRQEKVDGAADHSTVETLRRLLDSPS